MKILLIGNLPATSKQMEWIENQPADLIIIARDASPGGEPKSSRSWVIRFPAASEKCVGGESLEWLYELRHVRLVGRRTDATKSIPVVFLPWPSPGRDDDWFVAAKRKVVDVSDSKDPWILITHSDCKGTQWPVSEEILTIDLVDIVRPTIRVSGVARVPKIKSRRVWIDSGMCGGPVPPHAWIP